MARRMRLLGFAAVLGLGLLSGCSSGFVGPAPELMRVLPSASPPPSRTAPIAPALPPPREPEG